MEKSIPGFKSSPIAKAQYAWFQSSGFVQLRDLSIGQFYFGQDIQTSVDFV